MAFAAATEAFQFADYGLDFMDAIPLYKKDVKHNHTFEKWTPEQREHGLRKFEHSRKASVARQAAKGLPHISVASYNGLNDHLGEHHRVASQNGLYSMMLGLSAGIQYNAHGFGPCQVAF